MANTKELRQLLGLTLPDIADLIGCSQGQLAMAETGQRKLPSKSRAALYGLEQVIQKMVLENPEPTFAEGTKTTALRSKAKKRLTLQLKSRELKAEKILQAQKQTALRLQFAEQFEQQPFLPDDGIAKLRVKILQRTARVELDTQAALLLQHQLAMAAIRAQLELLRVMFA
jgi:transcriptional regulator with XRE-family HTH domain